MFSQLKIHGFFSEPKYENIEVYVFNRNLVVLEEYKKFENCSTENSGCNQSINPFIY
jgi:hypothetical protein